MEWKLLLTRTRNRLAFKPRAIPTYILFHKVPNTYQLRQTSGIWSPRAMAFPIVVGGATVENPLANFPRRGNSKDSSCNSARADLVETSLVIFRLGTLHTTSKSMTVKDCLLFFFLEKDFDRSYEALTPMTLRICSSVWTSPRTPCPSSELEDG